MPNNKRRKRKVKQKYHKNTRKENHKNIELYDDDELLSTNWEDILDNKTNPSAFSCKICHRRFPNAYIQHKHLNNKINNCIYNKTENYRREKRNIYHDLYIFNRHPSILFKCTNCHKCYKRELNASRCQHTCLHRNKNNNDKLFVYRALSCSKNEKIYIPYSNRKRSLSI